MKERIAFYWKRVKEGRLKEMWKQTVWIYGYGKKHWFAMIIYTAMGMIGTMVSLGLSFASRDLVNIITGYQPGKLVKTFCIMILLGIGSTVINQITTYISTWVGMKVDAEVKSDIFEKILITDWESLTNYHTGDLLTRWNTDASNVSSGILNYIPNAIVYLFRFCCAFAVVIVNDASFALFAFMGMPVSLLLSKKLMNRMVNNNQRSAAMGAKMSGFNQETFSNIQTIKAFDLIGMYVRRLKELQKEFIKMRLDFQKMSIWTTLLMSTVGLLISYAAYGWGIYRVWSGVIDYGTMTMFLALSGTLTGTLHSLTSLVPGAIGLTTSAGRLMDIVEMPREDDGKREEVKAFLDENQDMGIGLTIDHLQYAYKNGTKVFENACMEARPHEIVGLVGPSGEGKTTMMRLLLSLVPAQGGEAYFWAGDSKEKRGYDLSPATRQIFSYVPQGNTMFSGTIAQNMRNIKEDASDEEIIEALKQACAWGFVEKLPGGINSQIQERGGGFSEGQAQRLSIARALLRDTPILLLDEATSALDVATERQVLRNIMGGKRPKTCIVTTHRPTVLTMCKRVYAIQNRQCKLLQEAEIKEMIDAF